MDCAQLRRWLLEPGSVALPEVRQHLDECPACRELASDDAVLARELFLPGSAPDPAPLSFAPLAAELARDRRWLLTLKSLPRALRWAGAAVALALPAALAVLRPRPDLGGYPLARFVLDLVALVALAALACGAWLWPLYRPRPRASLVAAGLAVAVALPWMLAWFPPSTAGATQLLDLGGRGVVGGALACLALGTALALPVWLGVGVLGRSSGGPLALALAPAIAAALAALAGLEIHCPITARAHLLGGHAPVALVLPLLALVVGRWRGRA